MTRRVRRPRPTLVVDQPTLADAADQLARLAQLWLEFTGRAPVTRKGR